MKIKTKLQLIIVAVVILLAGSLSLSFLWQKQAERQSGRELLLMELDEAIFERARIREEYFLFREERSKVQFFIIHKQIEKLLKRMSRSFTRAEEDASLNNMIGFNTRIVQLFNDLVRIDENVVVHTAATQELRQRIIIQMLVNARSLQHEGFLLLKKASETSTLRNSHAHLFSSFVLGLLGLFLVSFVVIIIRDVTQPLTKLQKGMEIIAGGNLDYKTDIRTRDEIGRLSGSFDSMTENLKNITVSRYELSKEVEMRVLSEDALRALSSRQEAILAAVPAIIMEVDNNRVYTWANSVGIEFFGEDVVGREAAFYFEGEQETYDTVRPLFNGAEEIIYVESWQRRKDGEKRLLAWWCRALKGEKGNAVGALSAAYDITERKQVEEELRKLNAEMEQRVSDRTAQLEAANRELEAFSYSVSHDLRAPLRSIDGFSQALLEEYQEKLDDTGKGYLERVRNATQRMSLLIDDLLKLSSVIRSGFRRESVDLIRMIREIEESYPRSNPDRAVDVVIRDGVVVQGDPHLIRIALVNLLDNAWKFTGKAAHPRIEFGSAVRNGETVYFIRDNGAGFDMAYADKLFGAFQRLHTKEEFAGTGIGLATVKRVIARHGGRVWAEGEVGRGATFYFTLPS